VAISSCRLNLSLGSASQRSCQIDRVARNGDVWRIGLGQAVNDGAVQLLFLHAEARHGKGSSCFGLLAKHATKGPSRFLRKPSFTDCLRKADRAYHDGQTSHERPT
jgi:hypothetical protein